MDMHLSDSWRGDSAVLAMSTPNVDGAAEMPLGPFGLQGPLVFTPTQEWPAVLGSENTFCSTTGIAWASMVEAQGRDSMIGQAGPHEERVPDAERHTSDPPIQGSAARTETHAHTSPWGNSSLKSFLVGIGLLTSMPIASARVTNQDYQNLTVSRFTPTTRSPQPTLFPHHLPPTTRQPSLRPSTSKPTTKTPTTVAPGALFVMRSQLNGTQGEWTMSDDMSEKPKGEKKKRTKKKDMSSEEKKHVRTERKITLKEQSALLRKSLKDGKLPSGRRVITGRGAYDTSQENLGSKIGSWAGGKLFGLAQQWVKNLTGFGDYDVVTHAPGKGPRGHNSAVADPDGKRLLSFPGDPTSSTISKTGRVNYNFGMTKEFHCYSLPISCANETLFPWVSDWFKLFQTGQFGGLVFVTQPLVQKSNAFSGGVQSFGQVAMSVRYNVNDPPPTSITDMVNSMGGIAAMPSSAIAFFVECAPDMTTIPTLRISKPGAAVAGDKQLDMLGWLDIATQGSPNDYADAFALNFSVHAVGHKFAARDPGGDIPATLWVTEQCTETYDTWKTKVSTAAAPNPPFDTLGTKLARSGDEKSPYNMYFDPFTPPGSVYLVVTWRTSSSTNNFLWDGPTYHNGLDKYWLWGQYGDEDDFIAAPQAPGQSANLNCDNRIAIMSCIYRGGGTPAAPPYIQWNGGGIYSTTDPDGGILVTRINPNLVPTNLNVVGSAKLRGDHRKGNDHKFSVRVSNGVAEVAPNAIFGECDGAFVDEQRDAFSDLFCGDADRQLVSELNRRHKMLENHTVSRCPLRDKCPFSLKDIRVPVHVETKEEPRPTRKSPAFESSSSERSTSASRAETKVNEAEAQNLRQGLVPLLQRIDDRIARIAPGDTNLQKTMDDLRMHLAPGVVTTSKRKCGLHGCPNVLKTTATIDACWMHHQDPGYWSSRAPAQCLCDQCQDILASLRKWKANAPPVDIPVATRDDRGTSRERQLESRSLGSHGTVTETDDLAAAVTFVKCARDDCKIPRHWHLKKGGGSERKPPKPGAERRIQKKKREFYACMTMLKQVVLVHECALCREFVHYHSSEDGVRWKDLIGYCSENPDFTIGDEEVQGIYAARDQIALGMARIETEQELTRLRAVVPEVKVAVPFLQDLASSKIAPDEVPLEFKQEREFKEQVLRDAPELIERKVARNERNIGLQQLPGLPERPAFCEEYSCHLFRPCPLHDIAFCPNPGCMFRLPCSKHPRPIPIPAGRRAEAIAVVDQHFRQQVGIPEPPPVGPGVPLILAPPPPVRLPPVVLAPPIPVAPPLALPLDESGRRVVVRELDCGCRLVKTSTLSPPVLLSWGRYWTHKKERIRCTVCWMELTAGKFGPKPNSIPAPLTYDALKMEEVLIYVDEKKVLWKSFSSRCAETLLRWVPLLHSQKVAAVNPGETIRLLDSAADSFAWGSEWRRDAPSVYENRANDKLSTLAHYYPKVFVAPVFPELLALFDTPSLELNIVKSVAREEKEGKVTMKFLDNVWQRILTRLTYFAYNNQNPGAIFTYFAMYSVNVLFFTIMRFSQIIYDRQLKMNMIVPVGSGMPLPFQLREHRVGLRERLPSNSELLEAR